MDGLEGGCHCARVFNMYSDGSRGDLCVVRPRVV